MAHLSLQNIFSRKNMNLIVGLLTLLVVLWVVMYAVPEFFIYLFNTSLGMLILAAIVGLSAMHDVNLAIGLGAVFVILYRFSHMRLDAFII